MEFTMEVSFIRSVSLLTLQMLEEIIDKSVLVQLEMICALVEYDILFLLKRANLR